MKKTEDIGSHLLFTLQVDVYGKPLGRLGSLAVEFDWPWETTKGKWLLYLTEIRVDGTSESRCAPPGDIINPLNLVVTTATCTPNNTKKKSPVFSNETAVQGQPVTDSEILLRFV